MRRQAATAALLALLVAGAAALAQSVHDVYRSARRSSDGAAPGFYRTAVDGTDSATSRTFDADLAQRVAGGDATLYVSPRHTISGSTAEIHVGLYGPDQVFYGIAGVQTSTSTALGDGTGFFAADPLAFPLAGATWYDVRCTDVSSGTVSLRAWTVGAGSQAAE